MERVQSIKKADIAVLISGSGTNLQALADACADPGYPAGISVVVSSNPDAYGLERAAKAGVPTAVVDRRKFGNRQAFEAELQRELKKHPVDFICLAGFMLILSPEFVSEWENRMLNTHPSLLPRHGGPGMYGKKVHEAVLASGDRESGASIHIVTAECDAGPVLIQRKIPVLEGDTADTLAERVLEQEHLAYVEAVRVFSDKRQNSLP